MTVPRILPFGQFIGRLARVIALIAAVLITSHQARAQGAPEEKTLLWEISGNGLEKPSYLYGTMHVRDKRVFDFADSVMVAFKRCSILAEETRLDSAITWLLSRMMEDDPSGANLRDVLPADRYRELDSMMQNAYGLSLDHMSHAKPWMIYSLRPPEPNMPKEKPTFLDAYLVHIARLEGMRVVGLETIQEESAIFDQLPGKDVDSFFDMGGADDDYDRMVSTYAGGDLAELSRSMAGKYSDTTLTLVLTRRNALMVRRMEPLFRQAPTFTAVGAAHLAGPKGIIALLRKDGFTVRPVPVTRTGLAARYVPPARKLEWVTRVDSAHGYAAEFPTAPLISPQDGPLGVSVVTLLSLDGETGLSYMLATLDMAVASRVDPAKLLDAMVAQMPQTKGKKRIERKITIDGVPAVEAEMGYGDAGRMRMRVVQSGRDVHLLGVITESAWHDTLDVERFFDGFRLLQSPTATADKSTWTTIRDGQGAYSIVMPADTHRSVLRVAGASGDSASIFMIAASGNGGDEYAMMYNDQTGDHVVTDDSLYMAGRLDAIANSIEGKIISQEPTTYAGYPARDLVVRKENELALVRCVLRGSRAYIMMAGLESDTEKVDGERFLSSLTLLPPENGNWRKLAADTLPFTISFPGTVEPSTFDTLTLGRQETDRSFFFSRDEKSGGLCILAYGKIPPKYRADDTTSVLEEIGGETLARLDSVISRRRFRAGTDPVNEIIGTRERRNTSYRVRSILHGNEFFMLVMAGALPDLTTPHADQFFDSFHPTHPAVSVDLFSSRLPQILADIDSPDTTRAAAAYDELDHGAFGQRDLPTLYAALKRPRPDDSLGAGSVRGSLLRILVNNPDAATARFLTDLYLKTPDDNQMHLTALRALAVHGNSEAFDSIASLLRRYPIPSDPTITDLLTDADPDSVRHALPQLVDLLDTPFKRIIVLGMFSHLLSMEDEHQEIERFLPRVVKASTAMADAAVAGAGPKQEEGLEGQIEAVLVAIAGRLPKERGFDSYLRREVNAEDLQTAFVAAYALEERGIAAPDSAMERLAADPYLRFGLYRGLVKIDREKRFPARYRNQRSLAEGMLVAYLKDRDATPDSTLFVTDRELTAGGKRGRFFLFRVHVNDTWYPCVVGPYPTDSSILDGEEITVSTPDGEYDESRTQSYFDDAVSHIEGEGQEQ